MGTTLEVGKLHQLFHHQGRKASLANKPGILRRQAEEIQLLGCSTVLRADKFKTCHSHTHVCVSLIVQYCKSKELQTEKQTQGFCQVHHDVIFIYYITC